MIRALMASSLLVLASLGLVVIAQRLTGWTFLSNNPEAISTFLSSLAQFAAIPVTIAFGVIVLIIQQQATAYTGRAGALVVNSPGFMFVVVLLFEVPALCIFLLGWLDLSGPSASRTTQEWAAATVGPLILTFMALARFAAVWFARTSPAEFSGFVFSRAVEGVKRGDRNTVSLAVRGLGESLNNLALSTDYMSLHLSMNHLAYFLQWYVREQKSRLKERKPAFFGYQFPDKRTDNVWVEREVCTFVRDATDSLLGRLGPAETIYHLVDSLRPFGGAAVEVKDIEALEVLADTFVEMGTTERTFGVSINFNTRPLERSAEGALWARENGYEEAEKLLASVFFILFAYLNYHVRRMQAKDFTSSLHETEAKKLKDAGIDFSEAAEESRKSFEGYWIIRFPNPDDEKAKALKKIECL